MNISDLLIIYLSVGAPCGVYFFLQNRKKLNSKTLWLKSFLTVIVWIPYAFVLLHDFATRRNEMRNHCQKQALEEKLSLLQKQLLQFHLKSSVKFSYFEFREVLDRYAGLTLACCSIDKNSNPAESEIFRIALRENPHPGIECLHRRNRARLKFHQNSARKDFLHVLSALKLSASPELLKKKAIEFVEILNDVEAGAFIEEIFRDKLQSRSNFTVQQLEEEVWNSKEIKPQPSSPLPIPLRAFTATTAKKD